MVTDEAALEVLRRLERVPELIALSLGRMPPAASYPGGPKVWMEVYMALDTLDNDVGALIEEAREALKRGGLVRPAVAVLSGSSPAGGH